MNEHGASAAATAAEATHVHLPGVTVVHGPLADTDDTAEPAPHAELGELISRERRRHAETLAEAPLPAAGTGGRVNCVLCFGMGDRAVEDAG